MTASLERRDVLGRAAEADDERPLARRHPVDPAVDSDAVVILGKPALPEVIEENRGTRIMQDSKTKNYGVVFPGKCREILKIYFAEIAVQQYKLCFNEFFGAS
jgi:hypothetical protein